MSIAGEWVEKFFNYLAHERAASAHTLRNYQHALREMAAYFENKPWDQLQENDFKNYLYELAVKQRLNEATVRLRFAAARAFYRFACKRLGHAHHPLKSLSLPTRPRVLPKFMTEEQVVQLLSEPLRLFAAKKRWIYLRDAAFLELLYSAGVRISEAAALSWDDVQISQGCARVLGKGKKERLVMLGEPSVVALKNYRQSLPAKFADVSAIFLNPSGFPLSTRAMQMLFKKYLVRCGLDVRLTPHKMRHSFATHMLDHGVDLRALQEMLGHARLDTTQIYTRVTAERLKQVYRKAHPRA